MIHQDMVVGWIVIESNRRAVPLFSVTLQHICFQRNNDD